MVPFWDGCEPGIFFGTITPNVSGSPEKDEKGDPESSSVNPAGFLFRVAVAPGPVFHIATNLGCLVGR